MLLLQKVAGGVLLGCLLLSFGAVLAAGSLVEEVQRPAAPEHTKRLRLATPRYLLLQRALHALAMSTYPLRNQPDIPHI